MSLARQEGRKAGRQAGRQEGAGTHDESVAKAKENK
jgi:predicted transposase YdaD